MTILEKTIAPKAWKILDSIDFHFPVWFTSILLDFTRYPNNVSVVHLWEITLQVKSYPDGSKYWTGWTAKRFESRRGTFLQVSTNDATLAVGDTANVTVATTKVPESGKYRISVGLGICNSDRLQLFWIHLLSNDNFKIFTRSITCHAVPSTPTEFCIFLTSWTEACWIVFMSSLFLLRRNYPKF